ncbi:transporter [Actinoplanes sp. SE50]|uniref:sulfite exporter TauE/SafE family protein n=1 Tax=unclassified Actinoplanes TaxID=2626549 RepID=UPI00023EC235|nr:MULTISPECIES: sulfite exporter TauE/SafE family protein [unclassified Actinoplanes]AEV83004.1 putative transmembrane protein [Actinoplanes sp. SE50/110]ATO81400.1 transporter [Actinoplanes sp. SE50]SLL98807.1 transporter [Actinoplanes sp. SE50/110]
MDLQHAALLLLGGVGSGLTGSIAGLASLVSYPVLLAAGLPPVAASMTNTVALLAAPAGTAAAARRELRGQGPRIVRASVVCAAGGITGGVLLKITPSSAFALIVPFLIVLGALALLFREGLQDWYTRPGRRPPLWLATFLIGIYGGYFGAAAGVLLLAAMAVAASEPFAVTNAVKTIVLGAANLTAAVLYALTGPVDWPAALLLGVGCMLGSSLGPAVVRRSPERPLRIAIAVAAAGLAVYLWSQAL